jgi:hypothetical protein
MAIVVDGPDRPALTVAIIPSTLRRGLDYTLLAFVASSTTAAKSAAVISYARSGGGQRRWIRDGTGA